MIPRLNNLYSISFLCQNVHWDDVLGHFQLAVGLPVHHITQQRSADTGLLFNNLVTWYTSNISLLCINNSSELFIFLIITFY